jgi:hypothetical protein
MTDILSILSINMSTTLIDLPLELILQVVDHLRASESFSSIVQLSLINKGWYSRISREPIKTIVIATEAGFSSLLDRTEFSSLTPSAGAVRFRQRLEAVEKVTHTGLPDLNGSLKVFRQSGTKEWMKTSGSGSTLFPNASKRELATSFLAALQQWNLQLDELSDPEAYDSPDGYVEMDMNRLGEDDYYCAQLDEYSELLELTGECITTCIQSPTGQCAGQAMDTVVRPLAWDELAQYSKSLHYFFQKRGPFYVHSHGPNPVYQPEQLEWTVHLEEGEFAARYAEARRAFDRPSVSDACQELVRWYAQAKVHGSTTLAVRPRAASALDEEGKHILDEAMWSFDSIMKAIVASDDDHGDLRIRLAQSEDRCPVCKEL